MTAYQAGAARVSSTVTKQNPRPRKYATASERQAAYRARAPEVCFRAEPKTVDKLDEIAQTIDQSRADLLLSMTKFALANHDWARFGLTHRPLPFGYGMAEQAPATNPAPIWKRKRPKSLGKPVPLTPKQKAAAKAMAKAAGRKYPNLVDNIAASRLENPTMKKPTPAQLAARARFAEMARSGAFKRKAKKATTKRKANPRKKTVSEKISQLMHEGYPQKQAVAVALNEQRAGKVKRNPAAKPGAYGVSWVSPMSGKPQTSTYTTKAAAIKDAKALHVEGAKNIRAWKWSDSVGAVDFNWRLPTAVKLKSNPAKFTASQLAALREHYSGIERIDPSSDSYIKLTAKLDAMPLPVLKQLADAKIKWISSLARNRVTRMERKPNPATGRKASRTKLNPRASNPIVSEARSRLPSNFKYGVQTKATENWSLQAAFKTKAEAVDYAQAIAKNYPRLPIRVITFTGGPM